MNKTDLVEELANAADLTRKDAARIVGVVFQSLIEALQEGEEIELRSFGCFRLKERTSRRGRNPLTGEPVDIPAKRVAYFRPAKKLSRLLNIDEAG